MVKKRADYKNLPVSGAPGEARTHNNGVGGHDFIQLDYGCGNKEDNRDYPIRRYYNIERHA